MYITDTNKFCKGFDCVVAPARGDSAVQFLNVDPTVKAKGGTLSNWWMHTTYTADSSELILRVNAKDQAGYYQYCFDPKKTCVCVNTSLLG